MKRMRTALGLLAGAICLPATLVAINKADYKSAFFFLVLMGYLFINNSLKELRKN